MLLYINLLRPLELIHELGCAPSRRLAGLKERVHATKDYFDQGTGPWFRSRRLNGAKGTPSLALKTAEGVEVSRGGVAMRKRKASRSVPI